jgi:23S rRNA (cytidine1920-2'-O)/16S rRNA (cytidine1409-2'-O)-methyltransferase
MKERIDILLVEKRLTESRVKAQWLIKNGYVYANNRKIIKPSKKVDKTTEIQLMEVFPYVGRGGLKLDAALKNFSISIKDKICVDIGASIGGFTDCLLQHGASKVYAIDTATDLLHYSLISKENEKIIIPLLGVDARKLIPIAEKLDICTIDVTFASITQILPKIKGILKMNGDIIALIKPIFEIDFFSKKKFKIIKDPDHLFRILKDLIHWNIKHKFFPHNIIRSPILGKEGSIEFLIHLRFNESNKNFDYIKRIKEIVN